MNQFDYDSMVRIARSVLATERANLSTKTGGRRVRMFPYSGGVTLLLGEAAGAVAVGDSEFDVENVDGLTGGYTDTTAQGVLNTFGWEINAGGKVLILVAANGDKHAIQAECP